MIRSKLADTRTIKALLEGAEREAALAGEAEPGAEHLLLAALDLPDGTARRAIERAGADPDALRDAIEAQHAAALRAVGVDPAVVPGEDSGRPPIARGAFRAGASARSTFQRAGTLARGGRGRFVGAHVVAAVAATEHGSAARALRHLGIDMADLERAARTEAGVD